MILLVVGADRVDAGKTTFSTGLLARTGGRGYKPRAGNDYWFDHDDCRRALDAGRLYGKDAARLAAAEGRDRPPERLNPVHRLWTPAPGGGTGLLGRTDREFLVDRIRHPRNGAERQTADVGNREAMDGVNRETADVGNRRTADIGNREATAPVDRNVVDGTDRGTTNHRGGGNADANPSDEFVVNATADVPDAVRAALSLEGVARVETVEELNDLVERRYVSAFETLAEEIADADLAVVESYGDVARPLRGLVPDAVAAVEPRRARIYRGDRFDSACEVARSSPQEGSLEKRVEDVVEYLDPVERVELPPLSTAAREDPDRVATAYEPAYEALLAAAAES